MAYEILVASGKGGAGKTTITASLSELFADECVVTDYDVDAANLSILLSNKVLTQKRFLSGYVASINNSYCINCGKCADACKFNAISKKDNKYYIDKYFCEGCGLCYDVCMTKAIKIQEKYVGKWFIEKTKFNSILYSARLEPASDNSGKLVSTLKEKAQEEAVSNNIKYIVSDAPPGIGCPVISSLSGADLLVLVVELGVTGINDAIRLIKVARNFHIDTLCVINKRRKTEKLTKEENRLKQVLKDNDVKIIGYIPYDKEFIKLLQNKKLPLESTSSELVENLKEIYSEIMKYIKKKEIK